MGLRKILTDWGYTDIQVFVETAVYVYNSVDSRRKEMMDYNWVENDDVGLITQSLKDLVYDRIKPMIGQEKIPFAR